jgi:hypothetical protein
MTGWKSNLAWLAAAVLASPCSGAPRVQTVDARWEEIRPLILNRQVKITDVAGNVISGVAEQVEDARILVRPRTVAGGPAADTESISRGRVRTIEFQRAQGKGRAIWTALLALAGASVGLLIGAAETFGEDGGPAAVAATAAIAAGGAAAGYGIGQRRDTRTVILRIVPARAPD